MDLRTVDPRWNVSIEFHGKVVEENGKPIADADVECDWGGWSSEEKPTEYYKTDSQGLFSVKGRGTGVFIDVKKEGFYTPKSQNRYFEYGDRSDRRFHQPKVRNPVLFVLKSKRKSEPLLTFEQRFAIEKGKSVWIDLETGQTGPSGDLQIDLIENEQLQKQNTTKWRMRLTVPNGGILSHEEEFPFLAPDSGYNQSIELHYDREKPAFKGNTRDSGGRFFVKASNRYARLEIKMVRGASTMRLGCFLNPSGSRNLEYDSSAQIKQTVFE